MDVLVAETSEFQRNGLKWMFDSSDLAIDRYIEVSTPSEFLAATESGEYHLILLNIDMLPDEHWHVLSNLANKSTVIGITERKEFETAVRCLEVGMYRLFVKPLSIQSLMDAIKNIVEKKIIKHPHEEIEKLRTQWIANLISGQVTNLREVWEQANQLGYHSLPSVVMMAKVSHLNELIRNKSDLWKKQILSQVKSVVESFCNEKGLIFHHTHDDFVVLYTPKKGEQKQETVAIVKELGFQLYDWVKQQSDYSLYIACGSEYKNPMHLYHSYEEAKILLSLEFYYYKGKVAHYADYPQVFNRNILDEIDDPFDEEALSKDNLQFVLTQMENNLNHMKTSGILPVYYKLSLIYILLRMLRQFVPNEKHQFASFLDYSQKIMSSESADEIVTELKEYFTKISDVHVFPVQHIVIERALDFINENYNKSITLEQVAEEIKRSPYYFSHLFKKVMNMTFVEYLTHLRVKKAKELLLNDDLTVSEIAYIIGYQDPNYFSRVFKAISGESPKQWKTQKNLEKTKNERKN
ncbi:helix-turn-helix domain-containing protein [Effusibacillus consociatus]|uniref:Helix-turn-helix domain-containing protein n=1 Tax=Effusibacillus consociatus TaxID=1117041 RepID=A0ABV9PYY9_9BACL